MKVNEYVDKFCLEFIRNPAMNYVPIKRGRPTKCLDDKFIPLNFSIRKSTISKIQRFKEENPSYSLDNAVLAELSLTIPVSE